MVALLISLLVCMMMRENEFGFGCYVLFLFCEFDGELLSRRRMKYNDIQSEYLRSICSRFSVTYYHYGHTDDDDDGTKASRQV
jgi:hypothetical protein